MHLRDRRLHPSPLLAEKNRHGQLRFTEPIEVKPGQHVLPAQVGLVDTRKANEANQDEEPRGHLQDHGHADQRSVFAAGCHEHGEAGKGQDRQRREQADVNSSRDDGHGCSHGGHLSVEEVAARQPEREQHLQGDEEE